MLFAKLDDLPIQPCFKSVMKSKARWRLQMLPLSITALKKHSNIPFFLNKTSPNTVKSYSTPDGMDSNAKANHFCVWNFQGKCMVMVVSLVSGIVGAMGFYNAKEILETLISVLCMLVRIPNSHGRNRIFRTSVY